MRGYFPRQLSQARIQKHQRKVAEKIQSPRGNPAPGESKSVEGFEGCLRADSGKYRMI